MGDKLFVCYNQDLDVVSIRGIVKEEDLSEFAEKCFDEDNDARLAAGFETRNLLRKEIVYNKNPSSIRSGYIVTHYDFDSKVSQEWLNFEEAELWTRN